MENNYEKRIGFAPRLGAKLVDVVIVMVLAMLIIGPILGVFLGSSFAADAAATSTGNDLEKAGETIGSGIGGFLAAMIISGPITGILYTLIEGFTGASPGKMMFGMQIANEDGTQAEVGTYIKRWAILNAGSLCILLSIIGLSFMGGIAQYVNLIIGIGCFMIFAEAKQCLHGKLSKTAVYNKSDLS